MNSGIRTALVTPPLVAALITEIAACGSLGAPSNAQNPGMQNQASASQRSGTVPGSSDGIAAALASVPAPARQVRCPAGIPGPASLTAPGQQALSIPTGFTLVAVVRCVRVVVRVPGRGMWLAEKRQAAVTGLARLMTALREPSAPHNSKGPIPQCLAPYTVLPWFVLVSRDGQVIRPRVPVNVCRLPIEAVLASLNSMHWITLSTTLKQRIVS